MTTRTSYWLLAIAVGLFLRLGLPGMGGRAPGYCGDSDNWLFFPGFFSMIVMGEVVGLVKKSSRPRGPMKTPSPIEDTGR